ncbi:phage tail assembly chaperone G [Clostridium merdae]|uniref:phage tail assembly chaperone G n=1 Tax=Clostridium merdae TaxID=1958780 RepID=UPI000A2677B9|nr:hypothetical protein [Clostridium merdae]
MKTLTLELGKKLYTANRVTAWQSREAFAINRELLDFVKRAKALDNPTEDDMADILKQMEESNDRKANLICEVYGCKFSADELLKALTSEEVDTQINNLVYGIMGIVQKNE